MLDFLESITHVVVHEIDVWVAGGRRLDPSSTAVTAEVDGTTYGFCCAGCRRNFLAQRAQKV